MIFNTSFTRHQESFTKTFSQNVTQEYKLMQVNLTESYQKEYGMDFILTGSDYIEVLLF